MWFDATFIAFIVLRSIPWGLAASNFPLHMSHYAQAFYFYSCYFCLMKISIFIEWNALSLIFIALKDIAPHGDPGRQGEGVRLQSWCERESPRKEVQGASRPEAWFDLPAWWFACVLCSPLRLIDFLKRRQRSHNIKLSVLKHVILGLPWRSNG